MDKIDGEKVFQRYWDWFRKFSEVNTYKDGVCEITLPLLNRRRSCIKIFATQTDSGALLSDYGETIGDLRFSGFDIDTKTRREQLYSILRSFGVTLVGQDELQILTSEEKLPDYMNELLQCMLTVDLMIYMAPHTVSRLHEEDTRAMRKSEKERIV